MAEDFAAAQNTGQNTGSSLPHGNVVLPAQAVPGVPVAAANPNMVAERSTGSAVMASDRAGPPLVGQVMAPPKRKKRKVILPLVLLAVIGGGLYAGYAYFTDWRFIVSTDDAYVKADVSIIAAKVSGYVVLVPVVENARVKAGDLLAKIDDGDYRNAVQAASDKIATQDATVERLGRQAEAQKAIIDQAQAQLLAVQADGLRANLAFDRAASLIRNEYTTKALLDQARADKDRGTANVAAARATVASTKATMAVLLAQQNEARHTKIEMQTALIQVKRDLSFTSVKAPFDGVIGNKAVQPGQYVTPGTRLLALVPLQSAYVEANFKETQLGLIKPGQPVDISVDAYGDRVVHGVVESFAPASGQQFSLLPPENATGNFTKIVQRVPVRIKVPAEVAREGILRPGLSVVASVRTRDESKPRPTLLTLLGLPDLFTTTSTAAKVKPSPPVRGAGTEREARQ